MPLLERFDPLPGHEDHYPRPVKLREMVGPLVIDVCHRVRPEPPPRNFPHPLVLVVEVGVIDQNPVSFLDLLRSQSVSLVESTLVLYPRHTQLPRCSFDVLRPTLELSDSCR